MKINVTTAWIERRDQVLDIKALKDKMLKDIGNDNDIIIFTIPKEYSIEVIELVEDFIEKRT